MKIFVPNSDAAILRGEEVAAMIAEVRDTSIKLEDRRLVFDTLRLQDDVNDDVLADLEFELSEDEA